MREVNINTSNIRTTGTNVSFPQRSVDLTVNWVDDAGVSHTDTRTVLFPNILTSAALPAGWLQDKLISLAIEAVRVIIGVDTP